MADSVVAITHESDSKDVVPASTNNLRRSKRLIQTQNIQINVSDQQLRAKPRVPRAVDPVQRRKRGQSARQSPYLPSSSPYCPLFLRLTPQT
jgi:hypothetical protein